MLTGSGEADPRRRRVQSADVVPSAMDASWPGHDAADDSRTLGAEAWRVRPPCALLALPRRCSEPAAEGSNEPVRERGMWPTSRLSARMRDEDHGSVKVIAAGVEG